MKCREETEEFAFALWKHSPEKSREFESSLPAWALILHIQNIGLHHAENWLIYPLGLARAGFLGKGTL